MGLVCLTPTPYDVCVTPVLFRDSPVVRDEALAQAKLAENVHDDLHGRVVCDGEGTHVQDAAQLQRTWAVCRKRWGMLCEIHTRV